MRALIALTLVLSAGAYAQTHADLDKKELAMIKGLEDKNTAARKAFFKSPKDPKLKKAYVAATWKHAEAVLVSPALGPKDKYPRSLKLYREILKVEPSNKLAKERISLIEGIYKSMGRPVPGGG